MATYIKDSTGNKNAEIMGASFTTDPTSSTLTWNGVDIEASALPLNALDGVKQWLIVEVRNINGNPRSIGKHLYSENVTDILTRVEAIRADMLNKHTGLDFTIEAYHNKTNTTASIYRGDESTPVALDSKDIDVLNTAPIVWKINADSPFCPTQTTGNTNIILDSGCDDPSKWGTLEGGATISGSRLVIGSGGRCFPKIGQPLEAGATYEFSIEFMTGWTSGEGWGFRFYIGDSTSTAFRGGTGISTARLTCPSGATTISVQTVNGLHGAFDDFTCKKV